MYRTTVTKEFKEALLGKLLDGKDIPTGILTIRVTPSIVDFQSGKIDVEFSVQDPKTGTPLVDVETVEVEFGQYIHLGDIQNAFTIVLSDA